jgi:hypothetical protein
MTRLQKITSTQRRERVKGARKLLKRLGTTPIRSNSKWKRLLNTDFSARISLVQKHNSTNTVICSKSKRTIPLDSRTVGKDKYSPVVLLYGGLSFRGLIPTDSPIFIDD